MYDLLFSNRVNRTPFGPFRDTWWARLYFIVRRRRVTTTRFISLRCFFIKIFFKNYFLVTSDLCHPTLRRDHNARTSLTNRYRLVFFFPHTCYLLYTITSVLCSKRIANSLLRTVERVPVSKSRRNNVLRACNPIRINRSDLTRTTRQTITRNNNIGTYTHVYTYIYIHVYGWQRDITVLGRWRFVLEWHRFVVTGR